jgi:tetratricopeptide (TPR) repeat protein
MTDIAAQPGTPPRHAATILAMVPPAMGPAANVPREPKLKLKLKRRVQLAPGQVIPGTRWQITRWLGEGNMGVVYEARHVEIDRRAAIKIVPAVGEDSEAVADFRSEASASSKIGSPNIVDVFDFAVLDDGRLMMAMEFVPGQSLREIHVADGCLSPDRLIGLFRQVCKGLQAAHEAGLVHRDIKPENIMVGNIAGRADTVKIVDFGIAAILGECSARHAGTPYYMPPEGLIERSIDGRYDIYSVGCVMYEMLHGKPPFVAPTLERVLQMHMYEPVPELVSNDDSVPRKLVEVINRCLAKETVDRYESMNELEAALCEAQIEGKLHTTWDDLPLPAIDPDRRAKLQARMPAPSGKRGVSGWWLPVLLAFGMLGGALAWPLLTADPDATAAVSGDSVVEGFVDHVYELAALAYYVYPPVQDPQADTAYKVLVQLEALENDEARAAANSLRTELASTLVRLGDEMWQKPGGEPFALDFYVQASVFDPTMEPARTRAMMTPGQLITLRRKAGTGDFTQSELIAVEPLQALSSSSPGDKRAKLEKIKARHRDRRAFSATAQLDTLIAELESPAPVAVPVVDNPPISDEAPAIVGEPAIDEAATIVEAPGVPERPSAAASKLVAKADAARKEVRLQDAEQLYHKALRLQEHRVDALAGLGRVYFEQGKYARSVTYFNLAVRRSGRDPGLRIALGDAYQKTLDYGLALEQYQKAKKLGAKKADERIARIEQRGGD